MAANRQKTSNIPITLFIASYLLSVLRVLAPPEVMLGTTSLAMDHFPEKHKGTGIAM